MSRKLVLVLFLQGPSTLSVYTATPSGCDRDQVCATKSLQSCPTLCHPGDCSPPASSVHGILQARILEWVALFSSRGSFQTRDPTCVSCVSCISRQLIYHYHYHDSPNLKYLPSESLQKYLPVPDLWQPIPVLLPGKSHGRRSLVGCNPWGREEWDTTEPLHFHFSLSSIEEGNDNPLQCSCLENPRDRGAWWAAVYGVAQSWT